MRQIHSCAWLLVTCSMFAACSGQEFSSSDEGGTANAPPQVRAGASTKGEDHEDPEPGSSGSRNTSPAGSAGGGGGATSAGGASSGGKSPDTGGGMVNGGGAATEAECPSGSITFRMLPSSDLPEGYFCDTGCGSGWLTITDSEGYTAFSISSACGIASCESCEALPCAAAACLPTPLSNEGTKLVWTGNYLSKDTCGQNLACQRKACVPPGKYKAKACADVSAGSNELSGTCSTKSAQACAEVTFDFPAKDTIDLVLKKP